jgi:hypothetical protein
LPLVVEETAVERRGLCFLPAAVVATNYARRPFIDASVGKKAREEARRGGKIARERAWRANAGDAWRLCSTDGTSHLPLRRH